MLLTYCATLVRPILQAVWALGNVAGDSPKCRDLVLSHGALMPLLAQLTDNTKLSMLRNATWTLSNFCRGKPQPPFEQVCTAFMARLCFMLPYGTFMFLQQASLWLMPCSGVLLTVVTNYAFLRFILQSKPALPALERLIHSNDEEVLTDACWALSYLSDGTNDKIQAVIEAGVCRRLVELLL